MRRSQRTKEHISGKKKHSAMPGGGWQTNPRSTPTPAGGRGKPARSRLPAQFVYRWSGDSKVNARRDSAGILTSSPWVRTWMAVPAPAPAAAP